MEETKVKLYGPLKAEYGSEFVFRDIITISDAIDAMNANFHNFRASIIKYKKYNVYINNRNIGTDELGFSVNNKEIKIVPVISGGSGSLSKIILGVALIGLSFVVPNPVTFGAGLQLGAGMGAAFFKMGVGLLLSGFAELIFSPPEDKPDDNENSYMFSGAVNISKQGLPVPIGYGRVLIGSTNISNKLMNYSKNYTPHSAVSVYTNIFPYFDFINFTNTQLLSVEYATILDVICEGEIEGVVNGKAGVYLDDVSVLRQDLQDTNIKDVSVQFRKGTQTQTFIPGFEDASNTISLNSEVTYGDNGDEEGGGGTISPIHRINQSEIEAILITLNFTAGLYDIDLEDGDKGHHSTRFSFKYRDAGNSTWRYLPFYKYISMDSYNYSTYVGVSGTTYANPKGAIPVNKGVQLTIAWKRPKVYTSNYDYNDDGGGYITTVSYGGLWIKVKIEYKRTIDSTWIVYSDSHYIDGTGGTYESCYYDGDYGQTCNTISLQYIYDTVQIELSAGEEATQLEYRVTLLSAQLESRYGTNTTISIKPTEQFTTVGQSIKVRGKALSAFKLDYYYELPKNLLVEGEWEVDWPIDIRIERDDQDDVDRSTDDYQAISTFTLASISEIINQKFTYPNTALVALDFNAETYNKIPKRSYDVKLLKIQIPNNYNPITRVYTGLWTGGFTTKWSDNPAWAFYDLITKDRYGLGQYIKSENINKWTLYEIGQYCDELVPDYFGSEEPRYRINTYITRQEEALVLLRHLASIFRGMVYWMDNKITATYDHNSDPVCVFSNANVADGSFTYTGAAKDTRYNTVYVSWSDPTQQYKNAIEVVEDTDDITLRGEIVSTDLTALGCTSRGQAIRSGRALLVTERETVVFQCSLDNVASKPGDIIEIYDRYRSNVKYSGRILKIVSNRVYLDGPDLEDSISHITSYTLRVVSSTSETRVLPDGSTEDTNLPKIHTYTFEGTSYNELYNYIDVEGINEDGDLISETTDIPENTIWGIYEESLNPQIFRIVSIEEKEPDLFEINCLSYNTSKQDWIDSLETITYPVYRTPRTALFTIEEVVVSEEVKLYGTSLANFISFEWGLEPNSQVKEFTVEYKYDEFDEFGGDWSYLGRVNDASYLELPPNTGKGWYTARVSAVLFSGSILPWVESIATDMQGSTVPPRDVTGFTYQSLEIGVIRLIWDKSIELDFNHYEVQNGISGCSWDDLGNTKYFDVISTHLDIFSNFQEDFLIKVVDNSAQKSINAQRLSITLTLPEVQVPYGEFTNFGYKMGWETVSGVYPISYVKVEEDAGFVINSRNDVFETSVLTGWSEVIIPDGNHIYYLTPYDDRGNAGLTVEFFTQVTPNWLSDITLIIDNLYVSFYFLRNHTSFPTAYVELKRGTTFVANIYGEYYNIREHFGGSFTYYLTPYDLAGRAGITTEYPITLDPGDIITIIYENIRYDDTIPNTVYYCSDKNNMTGPIDNTETWATHFSGRLYDDIQDQIDAGYIHYLIPVGVSATYSEEYIALGYPPDAIDQPATVEVRTTGTGDGNLTLELWQKNANTLNVYTGPLTYRADLGKYITTGAFTHIKVDYTFNASTYDTYTLETALIIGET